MKESTVLLLAGVALLFLVLKGRGAGGGAGGTQTQTRAVGMGQGQPAGGGPVGALLGSISRVSGGGVQARNGGQPSSGLDFTSTAAAINTSVGIAGALAGLFSGSSARPNNSGSGAGAPVRSGDFGPVGNSVGNSGTSNSAPDLSPYSLGGITAPNSLGAIGSPEIVPTSPFLADQSLPAFGAGNPDLTNLGGYSGGSADGSSDTGVADQTDSSLMLINM